jgi:hypothetical protein
MKASCAALAIVATSVLTAVPSLAAPTGSTAHKSATENLATPVASYECRRDQRGWHHMRGDRRITCRPARPRDVGTNYWGWRCEGPRCGWWHRNDHRWHDRG